MIYFVSPKHHSPPLCMDCIGGVLLHAKLALWWMVLHIFVNAIFLCFDHLDGQTFNCFSECRLCHVIQLGHCRARNWPSQTSQRGAYVCGSVLLNQKCLSLIFKHLLPKPLDLIWPDMHATQCCGSALFNQKCFSLLNIQIPLAKAPRSYSAR